MHQQENTDNEGPRNKRNTCNAMLLVRHEGNIASRSTCMYTPLYFQLWTRQTCAQARRNLAGGPEFVSCHREEQHKHFFLGIYECFRAGARPREIWGSARFEIASRGAIACSRGALLSVGLGAEPNNMYTHMFFWYSGPHFFPVSDWFSTDMAIFSTGAPHPPHTDGEFRGDAGTRGRSLIDRLRTDRRRSSQSNNLVVACVART